MPWLDNACFFPNDFQFIINQSVEEGLTSVELFECMSIYLEAIVCAVNMFTVVES
jgi:hypothetical protein